MSSSPAIKFYIYRKNEEDAFARTSFYRWLCGCV